MVSAQRVQNSLVADKNKGIKEKIGLDYSMPDYSVNKIGAKVMGERLAKILEAINSNYKQNIYLGTLSIMQSKQVEGLNYGRIKRMKLGNETKKGNEIKIFFNTELEPNGSNLKKSQLIFNFVDGESEDIATNDFFTIICRY